MPPADERATLELLRLDALASDKVELAAMYERSILRIDEGPAPAKGSKQKPGERA